MGEDQKEQEITRPKSVKIASHTYKIISDNSKECKKRLTEPHELWGLIDAVEQKIYIDPNIPDERWFATLVHEVFHGFMQFSGLPDTEKTVFLLSNVAFTFLVENRLLIFDGE